MVNTKQIICQKFVTIENGWTVLYVKFQKALYECLRSALLFYETLVLDLKFRGFIINPYDPSVANMMVDVNQKAITWNVNELKILHVDTYEAKK